MSINTLIFDLDGTLLNTLGDLHAGFNYAITKFGYKERNIEEIRKFVGNGIKKAIERAIGVEISEEKKVEIINVFKTYYKNHMYEMTRPYDGINELLQELKNKNYKIGIVSNKFDDAVKTLSEYYFKDFIDISVGEGHGITKKPNPDGVIKVIKDLKSDTKSSIYIGDSDVDIETAKNAKIPCISVLWGFRDKEFLMQHNGKIFAQTPKDILKIIEKKLYLI